MNFFAFTSTGNRLPNDELSRHLVGRYQSMTHE